MDKAYGALGWDVNGGDVEWEGGELGGVFGAGLHVASFVVAFTKKINTVTAFQLFLTYGLLVQLLIKVGEVVESSQEQNGVFVVHVDL